MMQLITAGVDIGSTMTKVVLMDANIRASVIGPTGAEHRRLANKVMQQALEKAQLPFEQVAYVVATGYGRINVPFADKQITEITCHARGVYSLFPTVRTVIDIGGQDSKAIKLVDGKVSNFVMNDKCAAGTGRFLEVIAEALGLGLDEMAQLSLTATKKENVSSTCTVFAEQEIVSRLSEGAAIENVAAGLFESIASRVCGMADRLKIERDVVLTGGGAKNIGLVKAFENRLGFRPLVPEEPLITGAIGAALLGRELALKALERGEELGGKKRRLEEATFFG
ncbi:MAG: acyl-CoA dehydratase activase [Dehalococcoidia bacterium]|nr:acyl-CoA dehydratase activase [Dehalococcoidia bacterium]